MIISGTGHRIHRLGGYDGEIYPRLVDLSVAALKKFEPELIISGMALGWDQALADAAIKLGIPFEAAVPFEGQESKWPVDSQRYYRRLLTRAEEVHIVSSGGFSVPKMQLRNEYMVDRADLVLALWNGSRSGTENAVIYARKVGKPVINLWSSWIKYK